MKKIYIVFTLFAIVLLGACKKKDENLDREIVGLGGDTWPETPLDTWLYNTFTGPYNINVKYRWDGTEYDNSKTLVPPSPDKVQPLMEMVKSAWIDPFVAEVDANFVKVFSPKNYVLVGSVEYNSNGTVTLGEAEGGIKITLYNINNFKNTERAVPKRILKTIHHEFTHILNQNIMFPSEFQYVTPGGYTADWNNTPGFAASGFITQYAQAAPLEDFAEMVSIMLTEGKLGYEAILAANTSATAVANIRKKEGIVAAYYKQAYDINIYALQNRVQAALNATAPESPSIYLGSRKIDTVLTVTPDATAGMSSDFMSTYETAKSGLHGYGSRVLNYFSLIYTTVGQVILRVNYANSAGTVYNANFTHNVSTNANGNISLTLAGTDSNANGIAPYITALTNYLTQNQFAYKYFYSADYSAMYVGLVKASDSNSYFYGTVGN